MQFTHTLLTWYDENKHSYYVPMCPYTIGVTDYVQPYSAALHKDNFYAVQFHPEKSGPVGERIIKNFLSI